MKNLTRLLFTAGLSVLLVCCEKANVNSDLVSEKDEMLSAIAENFLDNTVFPTYKTLAA